MVRVTSAHLTDCSTGWRRETEKFEIIRKKKKKETYKTLFDPENVFYKSGNFIRHHF
jgi:hypothetical protein